MVLRYWTLGSIRWDGENKQGDHHDCATLLLERVRRPQSRVGESRQRLENSMSLWARAGSLEWGLESSQGRLLEWRELYRKRALKIYGAWIFSWIWSTHMYKETTGSQVKNHLKVAEGKILRAHTQLGAVCIHTSQGGKHNRFWVECLEGYRYRSREKLTLD